MTWIQLVSLGIFFATFFAIFLERIHRTIVAITAAAIMLVFGMSNGFYSQEAAFHAVDFNTILLLLWMMLTVVILEKTGYLQCLAIHMAKKSKGQQWPLLVFLGTTTTVLSTMLDNVTTVVVIAPVSIAICKTLRINPIPYLMAEAMLSDTGGVATLIGDPPNVIIGSAANLTFNEFLLHLLPITFACWLAVLYMVKFFYREELEQKSPQVEKLMAMQPAEALNDWPQARKVLIVLAGVMLLFLFHGVLHLEASTVAFIGFATAFAWARPDPDDILRKIDWSVLMFFSALFILVGGVHQSGALEVIGESLVGLASHNPMLASMLILWGAAVISAVVDNIPFTIAMVPVIKHLETVGIPTEPLWWALAMGAGFGGNGTPIGSTANVVIVSLSEKTPYRITFRSWLSKGLPVMIVCCVIASILMLLFFHWYSDSGR